MATRPPPPEPDSEKPAARHGFTARDDGIRTRDPHLGKVMVLVHVVSSGFVSSLSSLRQSPQSAGLFPVSRQPFNALNNDRFRRAQPHERAGVFAQVRV